MNNFDDKHRYDHLLELPHHRSKTRNAMSITERAAQFGAFRALTGYEAAISETGRQTSNKIELDEYQKARINYKLQYIIEHISDLPEIAITYFVPDQRKQGGKYAIHTGIIQKIHYYEKKVIFFDGKEIYIEEILSIDGDIFNEIEF